MSQKIINTDDLAFLLYEMLDIERFTQFPRYEDHSRDTFDAAIELALKVASETFAPHNRLCDEDEPRFENGKVVIRPEVSEALAVLRDTGLMAASQGLRARRHAAAGCRIPDLYRPDQRRQRQHPGLRRSDYRRLQPDHGPRHRRPEAALR
ncbi:acyl-CoA dehydrogenase family protein [Halopseudomonas pachastrellae]|nr:acyl-CoA dehydrogenase family protein [Halopseudomonas pachastrellae]